MAACAHPEWKRYKTKAAAMAEARAVLGWPARGWQAVRCASHWHIRLVIPRAAGQGHGRVV